MSFLANTSSSNITTVNEMESKINTLERSNFDLKMRLHYLHNKFVHQPPDSPSVQHFNQSTILQSPNYDTSSFHLLEDGSMEILTMREENEFLKKRVQELESQTLQLQLLRDREQGEYQKLLDTTAKHMNNASTLHIEETRKREREVALAIAEHDAVLIKKLQEENTSLQHQLNIERNCTKSVTDELAKCKSQLDERVKELEDTQKKNQELQVEIGIMKDRLSLFNLQHPHAALFAGNHGGTPAPLAIMPPTPSSVSSVSANPTPATSATTATSAGAPTPMVFAATSNGQQTSIFINSANFTAASNVHGHGQSSSSSFTMSSNPNSHNNMSFNIANTGHHTGSGGLDNYLMEQGNTSFNSSKVEVLNESMHNPTSSSTMSNNNNNSQSYVRHENEVLKQRLQKLQQSIDNQEGIINMLKSSANEISLLENQEIKRLQQELDRCLDEKERLRGRYQKLEIDLELSRQEAGQLKRQHEEQLQQLSVISNPANSSVLSSGVSNGVSKSPEGRDVYEKTIDLYKQREHELLAALEGVIQRCQELEALEAIRLSTAQAPIPPAPNNPHTHSHYHHNQHGNPTSFYIPQTPHSDITMSSRNSTPSSRWSRSRR